MIFTIFLWLGVNAVGEKNASCKNIIVINVNYIIQQVNLGRRIIYKIRLFFVLLLSTGIFEVSFDTSSK